MLTINGLRSQFLRSQPNAHRRTLSRKKHSCLPRAGRCGALGPDRKGSYRPACQWCFAKPVQELGPACADPITSGVRGRKAAVTTLFTRLLICDWNTRPASGPAIVSATKAARDFQRKTANGPFVLPVSAAAKNWRLEIPNKHAVSNLIHVSYEVVGVV